MNEDPTVRRQKLGRLLRRAREAAGLTQIHVARKLDCGQAKINKIETTLVGISLPELAILIDLYELSGDEAAELRMLAELDQLDSPARTKRSSSPALFIELTELEPEAREIRCWHSERMPGTLQSQLYVLKLYEPEFAANNAEVTHVLREWTARSKVLTGPNPPRYRVILSESSIHRMPGGGDATLLRVDQTGHLLKLMDTYEQLEVRILPFDARINCVDSDFQHLTFHNADHCEFVYIEHSAGARKLKAPHELSRFREDWEKLSAAALDLKESRKFLTRFADGDGVSAP